MCSRITAPRGGRVAALDGDHDRLVLLERASTRGSVSQIARPGIACHSREMNSWR